MLKGLTHWLAATLLLTSLPAWPAAPRWQDPDYIRQSFLEIALQNEYQTRQQRVRKWRQPIKVFLDHRVADQELHTELAQMHIDHLQALTGHPINLVSSQEESNVHWVYTRQSQWEAVIKEVMGESSLAHARSSLCMANFATNLNYELIKANIVIPVDQARDHGKLLACVVEEMTQIMGLPNDSDKVYPSIFNDHSPEDLLSPLDALLLKLLYAPEIKAGMTREEAEPVIEELLLGYLFDGTIDKINREVLKGELYQLMGYR